MFVDSGFIIIEEFTSTESEDWNLMFRHFTATWLQGGMAGYPQGVASYHKPFNTLRSQLVKLKDKTPLEKWCGLVYKVECGVSYTVYWRLKES